MKLVDPVGFIIANNLTYKDSNGKEQKLDIVVLTGEVGGNIDKAKSTFKFKNGMVENGSATITIESGVNPSHILNHEIGHIFGFSLDPVNYFKATRQLHNCQDPANRNHLQSKSAMDWQEQYNNLKKYPELFLMTLHLL